MPLRRPLLACLVAVTSLAAFPAAGRAQALRPLRICVVSNGGLTEVAATYSTTTGDTLVQGRPFSVVHPIHSGYATTHTWYRDNEAIAFGDDVYAKYGLPRVLGPTEVTRIGAVSGVGVFAEPGTRTPQVLYLPVRTGCEFQPYTPATGRALLDFAESAIARRDYTTAHRLLARESLADDGRALAMLGGLHHFGYGVQQDTAAAGRLYDRAIASRGVEGYTGRGLLAVTGGDVPKAVSFYRTGVLRGSAAAAARLAGLYLMGRTRVIDAADAARLLRTALSRANGSVPGYATADMDLATLYERGNGIADDATQWFASDSVAATERGNAFAQFRMGRRYEIGLGTWPDSAMAARYYRMGARGGDQFNRRAADRLGIR